MILWLARSAMVTLYPRTDAFPGIEDMDLDAYLLDYKRECATVMWIGFVLGTLLYHLTPLLTVLVPLPAFALSERLQALHAERLVSHPVYLVRQPVFLLKMVAGLRWGSDPRVRERFALAPYPADPGTRRLA